MTLPDAIRTESLTKYYGPVVAVESLDLTIAPGEIYGFLGPNGAGKTTTIRILLDLVRATSGRAQVYGLDCRKASVDVRRHIGYLPAEMPLYREMTGAGYLQFLAAIESRPVDSSYQQQAVRPVRCQRRRSAAKARPPVARDEAQVRHHPGADGTMRRCSSSMNRRQASIR